MDGEAGALYIRFRADKVARTIPSRCDHALVNVDLNVRGDVVGIEAIGVNEVSVRAIMMIAGVDAPNVNFGDVKMRWAGAIPIPA